MAFSISTIASLAGSAISSITEWAGSAVVAEFISTGFSYLRDRKLPADSEAELKRVQAALPQIKAVMGIVEALKVKDPNTNEWVEQFRRAVEASQDVLDELEYKRLEDMVKTRDEAGGSTSSLKKRKASALNDDTLERLKKALTMLDRAVAETEHLVRHAKRLRICNTRLTGRMMDARVLLLSQAPARRRGCDNIHDLSESQQETVKALRPQTTSFLTETEVLSRETTSFLVERELFGREVEKHKIIDWLKRPTDVRLSSFGIVGVGGLGKTTLVQFAYQEMLGLNHFDETIWVCVSTNFSIEDIMRKMLGELDESSCNGKPLNALQETLKEKILLKKLLIVLDDVPDDEKMGDWEKLVAPLRFVQQGSKILFTTRMKPAADLLKFVISTEHQSLTLQGLGEQELRLLFQNYAFRQFNLDNHRDLQAIGDQILKMLRGSPLAAKVIGSLLNSHMDHQFWRRILNHESLNLEQAKDVVDNLKLSYYHLPANLQVCSSFCSIFPEHPGRVRGVGAYRGWKEVFDGPKSRKKSRVKVNKDEIVAQIRKEVSMEYDAKLAEMESRLCAQITSLTQPSEQAPPISPGIRRSSQASGMFVDDLDNLKDATTCNLVLWHGTIPLTVAKGIVHPGAANVHNAQLRPDHVHVQVDLVMEGWERIPLPVPIEVEMLVLDDARKSFVQWPKSQIILDKTRGDGGSRTEEMMSPVRRDEEKGPDRRLLTEEEYNLLPGDLRDLHDRLMAAPEGMTEFFITVPPGMFLHDGSTIVLSFEDFKDLLHASSSDKWLDVAHITIFLMKLVQNCGEMAKNKNLCAFVDPGRLNATNLKHAPKESIQYLCDAMHRANVEKKRFILVPYHQSQHWCLLILVPTKNVVFVVDSAKPKENVPIEKCKDIFPYVKKAFAQYIKDGGLQNTEKHFKNKLNWRWWLCPQQLETWECGYYMMIFMFDFVERMQFQFPNAQGSKQDHYTKEQIDDLRCMWARWFRLEFCNAQHGFV